MTDKKANGLGAGTIEIDGVQYATKTFDYEGVRYVVRELSVDEGDDIYDATIGPDGKTVNVRLNNRMYAAKGLVSPETSVEAIGKLPSRRFLAINREINALNSLPEANPTAPGGSPGPTSPAGGEPLPTA